MSEPSVVAHTWRALATARRAVPLGLLLVAALAAEWLASGTGMALAIDAGLFVVFAVVAPAAFRLGARHGEIGQAVYVLAAGGLVLALGAAMPPLGVPFTYVIDPAGLGILAVLFVVGGWGLGRDIELEQHAVEKTSLAQRNAMVAEQNALLAMRAQLDPHFLFNTLNAIAEWCRQDPVVAEKATLELAAMLRAMLAGTEVASWPLSDELALVRRLCGLYEIRDRKRFRFRIEAPDPLPAVSVPPMLLLPLIENAITHGPAAGHDGEIVVAVDVQGESLRLCFDNPGAFRGRRPGGHGLDMVEKRLRLAYGDAASFSIGVEGDRTAAVISAPLVPPERA